MPELPSRAPDGAFATFGDWVNDATTAIGGMNALCADARDRICRCGADFMRARAEGAFPVRYWFGEGDQTPAQQRKAERLTRRALMLRYPWRRRMH